MTSDGLARLEKIARWGEPRILFNVHVDTVPPNAGWTHDPWTPTVADGRVTGLGACDTKGAIAAILCAIDRRRPEGVAVLFSGVLCASGSALVISVSMKPGATQLTVMLRLPTSCASDLVKPINAAFAAA